ncbi:efflux transporter outer membrane subunit [Burkholderia anthina]|uniref:efflux transporter outer membrane subunit n=1 Tax=Burkholderia anthina TaxID=179879 RepID=UPI001588B9D8|nr:efflux transporter outer membrane subunit [Burkholderia anthina]
MTNPHDARQPGARRYGAACSRVLAPLVLGSLLGGCVVGPDYKKPLVAVPDQWAAAKHAASAAPPDLSHWWTRLHDPMLNQLVDEAVAGNLDVATAAARIREARAVYRQAGGARLPGLNGTASVTRSGGGAAGSQTAPAGLASNAANPLAGNTGTIFQAGFDASWELDLFGANRRALEAAKYGMEAAQWNLRSVLLTLIGDVALEYVQARGYQARFDLARETAASQENTARLTRLRFDAGAASGLDAANATGQAETTRSMMPTLETAYAQAVHGLSVLTGEPPEALMARMKAVEPIPVPASPVPLGVPAQVLLARPDVRLAERQYAQSTARVGQAEAARYPSVRLIGNVTTSGMQFGDLMQRSSIGWSFGPSITIPFFNGGRLEAATEIARAQRDQYFIAYRASVLNALKDVENASVALSRENARMLSLQASAASYGNAATLAHTLYRAGATGFLDVLTAERSLYSAQDSLIESQVLVARNYIALNKALGGSWDERIDTHTPVVRDTGTGPHWNKVSD